MMRSKLFLMVLLSTAFLCHSVGTAQSNRQIALRGLPFCAFIVDQNFAFNENKERSGVHLTIMMDQDDISEENLNILFQSIAQRYTELSRLEVQVETDLLHLAAIANRERITIAGNPETTSPTRENSRVKGVGGAFYLRSAKVELFRYNPNYPEQGMKTVIIRGKE